MKCCEQKVSYIVIWRWEKMMDALKEKYTGFHQQMLTADSEVIGFYKNMGFERASNTASMWIFQGDEH